MPKDSKYTTNIGGDVDKVVNIDHPQRVFFGKKPIICPKCQNENEPHTQFCPECGTELLFTCPLCGDKTYLGANNCAGCGKSISKIKKDIEMAQTIRRGENKEISYTYHTSYETTVVREDLAIDEYILLKESGITFYKDDLEDAVGDVFLTNRRIIILGSEANRPRVFSRNYSYPLSKVTHVDIKTEKYLLFRESFLEMIWDGKVRKFSLPEKILKTWANAIIELKQDL
jgi:hypothetical protein